MRRWSRYIVLRDVRISARKALLPLRRWPILIPQTVGRCIHMGSSLWGDQYIDVADLRDELAAQTEARGSLAARIDVLAEAIGLHPAELRARSAAREYLVRCVQYGLSPSRSVEIMREQV